MIAAGDESAGNYRQASAAILARRAVLPMAKAAGSTGDTRDGE